MITEEQIWNYLDGQLNAADRKEFELTLANDKQAGALFSELSALSNSLKNETLLSPSALFTDRVMAAVQMAPVYTPAARFSFRPFLLFALPSVFVIAVFAGLLIHYNIAMTYNLPVRMPDFKSYQLYFVVVDIVLLAYFLDYLEDRLNRKAFFA